MTVNNELERMWKEAYVGIILVYALGDRRPVRIYGVSAQI
jgi:hypothetical protein